MAFPLAGAIPGIASAAGGLANMFWPKKDPAKEAGNYLDQIPGAMAPYYSPYMKMGRKELGNLVDEYGNLVGNTGDIYNKLASGYTQSPGYQRALQEALQAGGNAAAAGGLLGTPMNQEQQMGIAQDIASKDFNNYLQSVLDLYGQGLQGEQGLENQGYEANTGFANMLGQIQGQKAQNAYNSASGQNQAMGTNLGNIFGGFGQAFHGYNDAKNYGYY